MPLESYLERRVCAVIRKWDDHIWVQKNDPNIIQGFPDRVVFYKGKVAFLEFKKDRKAPARPNQEWYIKTLNEEFGFARFIYPENEIEVLEALKEFLF